MKLYLIKDDDAEHTYGLFEKESDAQLSPSFLVILLCRKSLTNDYLASSLTILPSAAFFLTDSMPFKTLFLDL